MRPRQKEDRAIPKGVHTYAMLDRDGTIVRQIDHLMEPGRVELEPGAGAGLRKMMELGLGLVVLTNQSVIGRGWASRTQVDAVNARMLSSLADANVTLDGLYVCPHAAEDGCDCRKPRPGLVERAVADHGFDPARSFVIGDKDTDIELGMAVGATTILVRTGYGASVEAGGLARPDVVVDNLEGAADAIERALLESPEAHDRP